MEGGGKTAFRVGGWVPRGVHSQPERHGQSQLLFAHLHCQTSSPVLVLCR